MQICHLLSCRTNLLDVNPMIVYKETVWLNGNMIFSWKFSFLPQHIGPSWFLFLILLILCFLFYDKQAQLHNKLRFSHLRFAHCGNQFPHFFQQQTNHQTTQQKSPIEAPCRSLKIKATSFSDIFWSEQNWACYSVFVETCAHTLLGPNVLQCSFQFSKLVTLDEAHVLCLAQQLWVIIELY